jgi:uncharacterized membrane protein YbaN (DUF454 family)
MWRIITGYFFVILGFIGLFLPVLQGVFFIILGLFILAPESKFIRKGLEKFREKYPGIFLKVSNFRQEGKMED